MARAVSIAFLACLVLLSMGVSRGAIAAPASHRALLRSGDRARVLAPAAARKASRRPLVSSRRLLRPVPRLLAGGRIVRRSAAAMLRGVLRPAPRVSLLDLLGHKLGELRSWRPGETRTWVASTATLGLAEASYLSSKATPLLRGLRGLGFIGGLGLAVGAARDLRRAEGTGARLDAAGDLLWGVEGMLEFAPGLSSTLGKFAPMVGALGGLCQSAVGIRRIVRGIRLGDRPMVKLGLLDFASGQLWLAWDVLKWDNPLVIGGFVGLMIGREAYANRKALAAFAKGKVRKVRRGLRRTAVRVRRVQRSIRRVRRSVGERVGTLRQLATSLLASPGTPPPAVEGLGSR